MSKQSNGDCLHSQSPPGSWHYGTKNIIQSAYSYPAYTRVGRFKSAVSEHLSFSISFSLPSLSHCLPYSTPLCLSLYLPLILFALTLPFCTSLYPSMSVSLLPSSILYPSLSPPLALSGCVT